MLLDCPICYAETLSEVMPLGWATKVDADHFQPQGF